MFGYRVPAPDQAMLISGGRRRSDGAPFRVIIGSGKFVPPWYKVRYLGLDLKRAEIAEKCITRQGLNSNVQAVIAFKVAPDLQSIYAAGQRFLNDQKADREGQDEMTKNAQRIFAGHLRAIIGAMTLEEITTERQKLATEVLDASKEEMSKLGLLVDSFQIIHADDDNSGYFAAMAAPHNAAIQRAAKIAQAQADQAAAEAQQLSDRKQAEFVRETQMQKAQWRADTDRAEAEAAAAGPLAQAEAQQKVIAMQGELAERSAELREKQLVTEIEKPAQAESKRIQIMAEANAIQMKTNSEAQAAQNVVMAQATAKQTELQANAQASATRATGSAEAERIEALGLAQAAGERAKADAMAANDRAQLDLARINIQPEVARALASGLANANLTVLNGSQGMTDVVASLVQQARMIYDSFKDGDSPSSPATEGTVPNGVGEIEMSPNDFKGHAAASL